jgi:hypothetical protein
MLLASVVGQQLVLVALYGCARSSIPWLSLHLLRDDVTLQLPQQQLLCMLFVVGVWVQGTVQQDGGSWICGEMVVAAPPARARCGRA